MSWKLDKGSLPSSCLQLLLATACTLQWLHFVIAMCIWYDAIYHENVFMWLLFFSLVTQDHCCILYSIIGWNCSIGVWSRVEGSRCDPNPNEEFAKPDGESLFGNDGKLTPSITVLGEKSAICKPGGNYGSPQSIYMKPRSPFKSLKLLSFRGFVTGLGLWFSFPTVYGHFVSRSFRSTNKELFRSSVG